MEMKLWMRPHIATLFSPLSSSNFRRISTTLTFINSPPRLSLNLNAPSFSFSAAAATLHTPPPLGGDQILDIPMKGSKVLIKGMRYHELEKWVQSYGYRPAQALMLWKRLYGNNIWAHSYEELEVLMKYPATVYI